MTIFNVPVITKSIDVYQVDARSGYEAAALIGAALVSDPAESPHVRHVEHKVLSSDIKRPHQPLDDSVAPTP